MGNVIAMPGVDLATVRARRRVKSPSQPNKQLQQILMRRHRKALVRHHSAKRRSAKLLRTPPWADLVGIRAIYAEAERITRETGVEHHVDHDIPLQGRLVSGLHVHNNLQILTGSENSRKKNRFEIEE